MPSTLNTVDKVSGEHEEEEMLEVNGLNSEITDPGSSLSSTLIRTFAKAPSPHYQCWDRTQDLEETT